MGIHVVGIFYLFVCTPSPQSNNSPVIIKALHRIKGRTRGERGNTSQVAVSSFRACHCNPTGNISSNPTVIILQSVNILIPLHSTLRGIGNSCAKIFLKTIYL